MFSATRCQFACGTRRKIERSSSSSSPRNSYCTCASSLPISLILPVNLRNARCRAWECRRECLPDAERTPDRPGNHQRLLLAQGVGEQAERSDLGWWYPSRLPALPMRQHRDDVIELRGRRNIGIEFAAGIDQDRRGVQAFGLQQRCQQRVLVFAIAVLVCSTSAAACGW